MKEEMSERETGMKTKIEALSGRQTGKQTERDGEEKLENKTRKKWDSKSWKTDRVVEKT